VVRPLLEQANVVSIAFEADLEAGGLALEAKAAAADVA